MAATVAGARIRAAGGLPERTAPALGGGAGADAILLARRPRGTTAADRSTVGRHDATRFINLCGAGAEFTLSGRPA